MTPEQTTEQWNAARVEAMTNLDTGFFAATMKNPPAPDLVLAGLHQARYECPAVLAHLRHESAAWLRANGLRRMKGLDWPADEELPA